MAAKISANNNYSVLGINYLFLEFINSLFSAIYIIMSLMNYENSVDAAYSPDATILPPSFYGTMPPANQNLCETFPPSFHGTMPPENQNFGETFPPDIPDAQFQNVPMDSGAKDPERKRDEEIMNNEQQTPPVVESAQTMASSSSSINVDDLPFKFLFGPLPVSYCLLFYILSFFAFILFVLAIIGLIVMLIKPPKGFNWIMASTVVFGIILYFVVYMLYRMLFNMCSGNHV